MGTLAGKFTALRTDKAYQSILLLKSIIEPDTPERRLWFEVLARAIMDIGRKDYYKSDWLFTQTSLEPICEALNTYPEVILRILEKHRILASCGARTAKTTKIPKPETTPDTKMEFETYENDEIINQTIQSDVDFYYNPDRWYSRASGV
jgi:hypothetical protein